MDTFEQPHYRLRRKIWHLFGQAFHLYDRQGRTVMYSKLKAFKLKEDIRVCADESMSRELLTIRARSILDFGATYDVMDTQTHERLGALLPQTYHGRVNNQAVLVFTQYFNLFVQKMDLDFSMDHSRLLNRWLGIAAAILIMTIEGRQQN